MAAAGQFPPVEGFLQKKGGGTSLLGSKGWSQRYVRIENGELSWWKSKNDASTGAAPRKDARVPLKQYHLEVDAKGDGKYFSFAIVAKDKKLLTSPKLREKYEFRVHDRDDLEGWAKVFRVNGSFEAGADALDSERLQNEALEAAAPKELLDQLKTLSQGTEAAAKAAASSATATPAAAAPAPAAAAAATSATAGADAAPVAGSTSPTTSTVAGAAPGPPKRAPSAPARAEPEASAAPATKPEPEPEPAAKPEPEATPQPEPEPEAEAEAEADEDAIDESDPNSLWRSYADEDGDIYYVNRVTGDSIWEQPEGFTRDPEA